MIAFYDQCAIVYLLTYLSNAYTTDGNPTLQLPIFRPRSTIIPPNYSEFTSLEEFNLAAPKGYMSAPFAGASFGIPKIITINLDKRKVEEIRQLMPDVKVSTNDILHGILLKITARFHADSTHSTTEDKQIPPNCRVLFARNMRIPLGLGSEIVGDYARLQCLESTIMKVQNSAIAELSMASRATLADDIGDKYIRECKWFLEYKDRYGALCGNPDFMADTGAVFISNWSSFPYENILFDEISPSELLLSPTKYTSSQAMFVVIAFRGQGLERSLVITINTLHDGIISATKAISEETGLFSYEE